MGGRKPKQAKKKLRAKGSGQEQVLENSDYFDTDKESAESPTTTRDSELLSIVSQNISVGPDEDIFSALKSHFEDFNKISCKNKDLADSNTELEKAKDELLVLRDRSKQEYSALQKQNLDQQEVWSAETKVVKDHLDSQKKKIVELEDRIRSTDEDLKVSCNSREEFAQKLQESERKVKEIIEKNENLLFLKEKEKQKLRSENEKLQRDLQDSLLSREEEIRRLRSENEEMTKRAAVSESTLSEENIRLQKILEELNEVSKLTEASAEEKEATLSKLSQENEALKKEVTETKENFNVSQRDLQDSLLSREEEIRRLRSENEEMTKRAAVSEYSHREDFDITNMIKMELEDLTALILKQSESIAQQNLEIFKMKSLKEKHKNLLAKAQKTIEEEKKKVSQKEGKISSLLEELSEAVSASNQGVPGEFIANGEANIVKVVDSGGKRFAHVVHGDKSSWHPVEDLSKFSADIPVSEESILKAEIERLKSLYDAEARALLQRENDRHVLHEKYEALDLENEKIKSSFESYKYKVNDIVEDAQKKLDAAQDLKTELKSLRISNENEKKKNFSLNEELEKLRVGMIQKESFLKSKIQEVEKFQKERIASLVAENSDLQNQIQKLQDLAATVDTHAQQEKSEIDTTLEKLSQRLHEACNKNVVLTVEVEELKAAQANADKRNYLSKPLEEENLTTPSEMDVVGKSERLVYIRTDGLQKELRNLEQRMEEEKEISRRQAEMISVLKDELRRSEGLKNGIGSDEAKLEYFKNVLFQFLKLGKRGSTESEDLIEVLFTILDLPEKQRKEIRSKRQNDRRSFFGR
eukprot:GHVP01005722.1.p1 GENE.GHVP01005722.1~~GHVP01005722.1.p1  ORF type:complete len:814 (-),score=251.32 GHVP01005722.1:556-2997(-)